MKYSKNIVAILIFICLILNIWITLSDAFLIGNPRINHDSGRNSFEIIYEKGSRKVHDINDEQFAKYGDYIVDTVPPKSTDRINLDDRRLYLQWNEKWTDSYSIFYRILIGGFITKLKFEPTPYNPDFWGFGGGIQFRIPDKIDRFDFNISASWDWSYGWQNNVHTYPSVKPFSEEPDFTTGSRHDEVNWNEGMLAFWGSYLVNDKFDIYAGISRIRTKIYVELGEYNHTRWFLAHNNGGFAGAQYLFIKDFGLSCELHGFNEFAGIVSLFKEFK